MYAVGVLNRGRVERQLVPDSRLVRRRLSHVPEV
jgi:hypothetical protein